jgi:DNA invertase Pin-like site-specific DNA recombinase
MLIGYARVSTPEQNLDRQLAALRAYGCDKIFAEKFSGKTIKGRKQLERAIDALGTGDVLVVAEWDRATRSMMDGIHIMQRVAARGAAVKVLDRSYLDLTSKIGQGILAFLSALAEDERERINRRSADGRRHAKARGVRFGRPNALTPYQAEEARQRLAQGESLRTIAKTYDVAFSTISRLGPVRVSRRK